jgi:hypothetical protein
MMLSKWRHDAVREVIVAFVGEGRVSDTDGVIEAEDTAAIGDLVHTFNSWYAANTDRMMGTGPLYIS